MLFLIVIEMIFPGIIIQYPSVMDRQADLLFTYTIIMFLISVVLFFYTRSYQETHEQLKKANEILTSKNIDVDNELNIARRIQNTLIPQKAPRDTIHTFYKPMQKVGGNFLTS